VFLKSRFNFETVTPVEITGIYASTHTKLTWYKFRQNCPTQTSLSPPVCVLEAGHMNVL